jgi:hypothetical protein
VDETAESASAARQQALEVAHHQAFVRLIRRLVPPGERDRIPELKASEIASLVLSFGIDDEKTSSVRYIGRLSFQFDRAGVRRFLQSVNTGFAETRSKPVLLLPVFRAVDRRRLWDQPNPWFDAWKDTPPADGLVPLQLPAGDLADVQDITAEQASAGETGPVTTIGRRYGAGAVIVSEANLGVGAAGQPAINVSSRIFGGPSDGQTRVRSVDIQPEESEQAAFLRAALDIQSQIEEAWQRGNQLDFAQLNDLVAVMALADLREWVEVRRRLRTIAYLNDVQLVAATRRQVAIRLSYFGSVDQLRVALAQRDLSLAAGSDSWTLAPAPAAGVIDTPAVPRGEGREQQ